MLIFNWMFITVLICLYYNILFYLHDKILLQFIILKEKTSIKLYNLCLIHFALLNQLLLFNWNFGADPDFLKKKELGFQKTFFLSQATPWHFTNDNEYCPTVMNTNPFLHWFLLSSISTIYRLWLLSNTTGATIGAGVS